MNSDTEIQFLQFVHDTQQQLKVSLDSLAGKEVNLFGYYLGFSSAHMNHAAHGYVQLRRETLVDAAKLLVRPALETMFRILAVKANPALLYRIAYGEWMQDRKLVRPAAKRRGEDRDAEFTKSWADFSTKYAKEFPEHKLEETELKVLDAAKAGGVENYYDCAYRLYCQFTHGAFRATSGNLRSTDELDSRTMAFCVFSALDAVASIGGESPQLVELHERLCRLTSIDDNPGATPTVPNK